MNVPAPEHWSAGLKQGCLLGLAVLALVLPMRHVSGPTSGPNSSTSPLQGPLAAADTALQRKLDFGSERSASAEVVHLARWVVAAADNGAKPFAVLDKKEARTFVFDASGKLLGASPVLLGYAAGDDSVAGIGQRPVQEVRPEERTTPAGRFAAQPGRNLLDEDVLWVDYGAAVSMHRVRLTDPREQRLQRLSSPTASERRISYGCINLPVAFFEQVLWPSLGRTGGTVYVLPESKPLRQVFPQLPEMQVSLSGFA